MLQTGERAPEIDLRDLSGRSLRPLSPERGRKGHALVIFFKDECPTCRYTLPFVERIQQRLGSKGDRIFGVSQDGGERTRAFLESTGATFPVVLDDPEYAVSRAYGLSNVPSIFLVDADGIIRRSIAGFSRSALEGMASDLAASIGVPPTPIFSEGEQVLETKPG